MRQSTTRPHQSEAGQVALEALEPRVLLSHTSGLDHALYMPEGFSAPTAVEVVELAYADDTGSADWQLFAHYERGGAGDAIVRIAEGTLNAGQTDSVAVWGDGASLVRADEPYSLVLRSSTDDVTALLRHSDFGARTAQHFIDASDDGASDDGFVIPGLRRDEDASRDFIVFHNPGDNAATVRLELEDSSGRTYVYQQSVQGERRGGWNLQQMPNLPEGVYTARVTSDAMIVLAGSRYALERDTATIDLPGRSTAAAGAILSAEFDGGSSTADNTTIFIANPSDQAVQVRFRTIERDDGPVSGPAMFTVMVDANDAASVSLRAQGFTSDDDDFSIVYQADAPVSISAVTERRGNLIFTQPETRGSDTWFFDQGLIDRLRGDELRTEDVFLFNPTASSQNVTITFTFADGTRLVETKSLDPLEVEDVDGRIEDLIGLPTGGLAFTISVQSTGPLVAMLEHWDPVGRATEATSHGVPTGTVADLVDIAVF
ncbi:MAG: LEPR-XLL domain-containing protein [Phycisphaerales bacterium JB060]